MTLKIALLAAATLCITAAPAFAASHARDTFIKEQDTNGDGAVSKEEFKAGREKQFAGIDADHNGVLSHDEYVGEFKARLTKRLAASTDTAEKSACARSGRPRCASGCSTPTRAAASPRPSSNIPAGGCS